MDNVHVSEVPWSDRSCWPRIMQIEQRSFSQPWRIEDFQLLVSDERALNVGLWHGAELAGYTLGYIDAELAELHLASIAVDVPYRRQGWGGLLLTEILSRASQRQCQACRLEVRASNGGALRLYERFQFEASGRTPGFYSDPPEDAVLMRCSLKGAELSARHRAH